LLRAWSDPKPLRERRSEIGPDRGHWWWYIDEQVAQRRRHQVTRTVAAVVAVVAVVALAVWTFNRLFPVDPVVKALQQYQFAAQTAMQEGDYSTAREQVEQALQLRGDDIELNLMLAALAEKLDDPETAGMAWQEARSGLPDEANFLAQQARSYLQVDEVDKARESAEAAVALDPELALAHFFLGTAYELSGDFPAALESYQLAADLAMNENPQLVVLARTRMASLLQQQGLPGGSGAP
jgi:Tfp pilus assembly protein PilF